MGGEEDALGGGDGVEIDVEEALQVVFLGDGGEVDLWVAVWGEESGGGSQDGKMAQQPVVGWAGEGAEEAAVVVEAVEEVEEVG